MSEATALERFGAHYQTCKSLPPFAAYGDGKCTCGLDAAIAQAKAAGSAGDVEALLADFAETTVNHRRWPVHDRAVEAYELIYELLPAIISRHVAPKQQVAAERDKEWHDALKLEKTEGLRPKDLIQMRLHVERVAGAAEARDKALEEAAGMCEEQAKELDLSLSRDRRPAQRALLVIAKAIRALRSEAAGEGS